MSQLFAGFSRVNITPMLGIFVTGYFKPRYAEGVLDELEINTLALACGDTKVVLMSADLCGIKQELASILTEDICAATGGFTDVLLRHGASHVYAIDVGYGQLDWKLRNDERVTVMERTNARTLTMDMFPARPNLTVMDVSFISIRLILPVAAERALIR